MRISPKKTFKSFLGLINLIFIIPLNPIYSEGSNLKLNEPVTVAVRKFKNFAGDFAENGVIEGANGEKIRVGETIPVLLEKIEDKNGEVLVSASKAQKIKGWDKLVEAYEKNEPIMGKITSKCKGGCIVEHIDTGSLMFLPGSQISDKPLKDISHLMNEPQKFALIKLDKLRGNACVSRREIISSLRKKIKQK